MQRTVTSDSAVVISWRLLDCLSCFGQDSEQERLISSLQDLGLRGCSALEVYRSLPPATKRDGDKAKTKGSKPGKRGKGGKGDKAGTIEGGNNPVKTLQGVAKKLALGSLSARWETEVCFQTLEKSDFVKFLVNHVFLYSLTDWMESNMKMEKSVSSTRKLATKPNSARENGGNLVIH